MFAIGELFSRAAGATRRVYFEHAAAGWGLHELCIACCRQGPAEELGAGRLEIDSSQLERASETWFGLPGARETHDGGAAN